VTIALLGVYYIGRYNYTVGYQENEGAMNKQRVIGSVLVNTSKLATLGVFMWLAAQMTRGRMTARTALNLT
jgi:hypothetical protein